MDTESQTQTLVQEAGGERVQNRISQLITHLTLWQRLQGEGRRQIGWWESCKNMATFSWLNTFLIFVPIGFAVQHAHVTRVIKFIISFIAIMPLSKILDFGSGQLAMYCGKSIGDLIVITLNNAVETVLAIVLLAKCQLDLLQSTAAGVVLLRLLLVPGTSFLLGGAHVLTQELHPHVSQLNNTLLTLGVLTLLLPVSFFASIDRIVPASTQRTEAAITDSLRGNILDISRALSVLLIVTYIGTRIYLHNPPGEDSLDHLSNAPKAFKDEVAKVEHEEPIVNPWVCIITLVIAVILLAFTAEHLVVNIHGVEHRFHLTHEWFGLILLPFVSYSADGILSVVYFFHKRLFRRESKAPSPLAQDRSIDLAIQFLTFWLPFIVIAGWCVEKPVSLLFNLFEVAVLVGACFLVTFVTGDAKTNWVEGFMMVVFYVMIVVAAWFYPGQTDTRVIHSCSSVKDALHRQHQAYATRLAANPHASNSSVPVNHPPPNAEAVALLNERLQRILDLHHVVPKTNP